MSHSSSSRSKKKSKNPRQPPPPPPPPPPPAGDPPQPPDPSSVDFTTHGCSKVTYDRFIEELQGIVRSGKTHHRVPILHSKTDDTIEDHFLINLSNKEEGHGVTLIGQKYNLYLVAYKSQFGVFYFKDTTDTKMKEIFRNERHFIPIGIHANYPKLEGNSRLRMEFELGISEMSKSITQLHFLPSPNNKPICVGFMLFLQMISESSRLTKFNQKISDIAEPINGVYPTISATMYDCECQNAWGNLSKKFLDQKSLEDKLATATNLLGGTVFTEDDIKKGKAEGKDTDLWDSYTVDNMKQARYILKILKGQE